MGIALMRMLPKRQTHTLKIVAAMGMGIALLRMLPKRPFVATLAYSLAFAVSSPIGVGIGIAIDVYDCFWLMRSIYAISKHEK